MELHVAVIAGMAALLGAALSGMVALVVAQMNAKNAKQTAEATVQNAITTGFTALATQYKVANDDLVSKNEALQAEVTTLTGWVRDLVQHVQSLETIIRKAKIPGVKIPVRKGPHPLAALKLVQGGRDGG
jgi:type II secretory pathway pseudopilin PulG